MTLKAEITWRIIMNTTKFCTKCGKELPMDAEFCQFCGAKQSSVENLKQTASNTDIADDTKPGKEIIFEQDNSSTNVLEKKSKFKKYWWIYVLVGIVIAFISFSLLGPSSPTDVASDVEESLKNDNSLDVTSVKPDKESGTIIVHVKENKAIDDLYMGKTSTFKTVERTLLDLSKKYKDEDSNGYDLSYIQLMKPGTNDMILLSVDKGKIKYSALDDME